MRRRLLTIFAVLFAVALLMTPGDAYAQFYDNFYHDFSDNYYHDFGDNYYNDGYYNSGYYNDGYYGGYYGNYYTDGANAWWDY